MISAPLQHMLVAGVSPNTVTPLAASRWGCVWSSPLITVLPPGSQPSRAAVPRLLSLAAGQENPNRVTLRLCNLMFGVNAFQCLHQEYLRSRRRQGKLSKTRSVLSKTEEFLWPELLCKYRRIEGFSLLALPAEQLPAEERL